MRLNYDIGADALDVRFDEDGIVVRTERIDAGTFVDVDEHGSVLAIEVLGPERRWPLEEILERFDINDEDAELLRAVRGQTVRFSLSEPVPA
jgi:uncharacterized protein YuzE